MSDEARAAVYAPFKTFLTSLEALEQGLPDKIDPSVWQSLSGGTRNQLWSAYKFLGLIDDDGLVQTALQEIVTQRDKRDELLRNLLLERYAKVVEQAKKNGSQASFDDAMREYNVQGETLEKAIRFYLQAAAQLSLPISPHWKKKAGTASSSRKSSKKAKPPKPKDSGGAETQHQETPRGGESTDGDEKIVTLRSGGSLTLSASVAITKLSKEDRQLVFDLIDRMQEYEDEPKKAGAKVDGRNVPAVIEQQA
jgi:hypothetical protein